VKSALREQEDGAKVQNPALLLLLLLRSREKTVVELKG
jgi:hypothetical protein